jgi:predicted transposase/invertase (TIGR01784 family)
MSPNTICHDAFFKKALSIRQVCLEYMQMHLPEQVQSLIDLSTLQMQQDSFVEKSLKKQISDVLFSCKTNDAKEPAFIYLLCEHQSTPDRLMVYRLYKYIFAIIERHMAKNPKETNFPLVYPMVFYNGQKPHNCPMSLHELFTYPEIARKILYENYHLIDVHKIPDDELSHNKWAGTMQFFMKNVYKRDLEGLLLQFADALREIVIDSAGVDFLANILWYNKDSIKQSDEKQLEQVLKKIINKKEVTNIMGAFGEKYFNVGLEKGKEEGMIIGMEKGLERGLEQGLERGLEQGLERGKEDERYEVARRMLDLNMQIEMISLATGLSQERILKLK